MRVQAAFAAAASALLPSAVAGAPQGANQPGMLGAAAVWLSLQSVSNAEGPC